jgi:hypothetical protein
MSFNLFCGIKIEQNDNLESVFNFRSDDNSRQTSGAEHLKFHMEMDNKHRPKS